MGPNTIKMLAHITCIENRTCLCLPIDYKQKSNYVIFNNGMIQPRHFYDVIQMCDGDITGVVPFGKRDVESRDLSSKCCTGDMCNYPMSVMTTPAAAMTTAMPATTALVTSGLFLYLAFYHL